MAGGESLGSQNTPIYNENISILSKNKILSTGMKKRRCNIDSQTKHQPLRYKQPQANNTTANYRETIWGKQKLIEIVANKVPKQQLGFRSHPLTILRSNSQTAKLKNHKSTWLFLNMKKKFDTVWHTVSTAHLPD